jgi:hypothetical protein
VNETLSQKLNRLAKWRTVFSGWQLGTRPKTDPESQAVRDHREITMFLRAEVSAIARLLIEKGVVTSAEFEIALGEEADELSRMNERRFPGIAAIDDGLTIDPTTAKWMENWKP